MKKYCLLICITVAFGLGGAAQSTKSSADTAYLKVINQRAEKIVEPLGISDPSKALRVRDIIAGQYHNLNDIYALRDSAIAGLKEQHPDKTSLEKKKDAVQKTTDEKLATLHKNYISSLSKELTPEQIVQVKDGMTYSVAPLTYTAYVDMIPALTDSQKAQIQAWLLEAREHAMDAESSEKKHAWFGKYKGRINNYLSAQGYDSQKEREEWEKRLKARQEAKNQQ